MSQLTSHVLDTSTGKPAKNISAFLEKKSGTEWEKIGEAKTNDDGRITSLLNENTILSNGTYRIIFNTSAYFKSESKTSFYPQVTIEFEITDSSHYHIPLLISPFGFTTYRGS
jgi:hydroxyisourate hydrolase